MLTRSRSIRKIYFVLLRVGKTDKEKKKAVDIILKNTVRAEIHKSEV